MAELTSHSSPPSDPLREHRSDASRSSKSMTQCPSYEHLGLFWNPFGEVESELWPRMIVSEINLDELAMRLQEPGFALVLRGDAGRGKSTHLRSLHGRFATMPYTYLGPDASPRTPIPRAPTVFVDEAQRLARGSRRRLFRRAFRRRASLALTSHAELRGELEAAGFAVETITLAGLEQAKLEQICTRRFAWAGRAGATPAPIEAARLEALRHIHGDDLRAIQAALFDAIEERRWS